MTDIRKFEVEETSVIALRGSDDSPLMVDDGQPMTVTVYGPGSKPYAKAQAAQQNKLMERLRKKGKLDQGAEESRQEQIDLLVACTKEFSANIECDALKGEALYRAVYSNRGLGFISEQVAKHIAEWGNFTKGSPKP